MNSLSSSSSSAASPLLNAVAGANCCGSANTNATAVSSAPQLQSALTCPQCGHVSAETMPTDACVYFYQCASCQAVLKPLAGDCCVFCSYGSVPCPPIQAGSACC